MLVLSRKPGQKVVLPQQAVVLTIMEVRGGQVRVGITAPPEVPVHRQEIWEIIQQQAAAPAPRKDSPPPPQSS